MFLICDKLVLSAVLFMIYAVNTKRNNGFLFNNKNELVSLKTRLKSLLKISVLSETVLF